MTKPKKPAKVIAIRTSPGALTGLLARVAPFSRASASARAAFARTARQIPLEAGERAWAVGDVPTGYSFVARGIVKLVRPRPAGRSDIIGLFGPGEPIGIVAALTGSPYPADAVAACRHAEIVEIPTAEVRAVSERELSFANALAECVASRAARMRDLTAILSAGGVESRLAAFLLDLSERFGDVDDDGVVRIPIALSRSELASCTATAVETAIRMMSKWGKRGLVTTSPAGFAIADLEALKAFADPSSRRAPSGSAVGVLLKRRMRGK